jgi:hypothetical protein
MCLANARWSDSDKFPNHLKNSRLRTPSFSGLQDLFSLNFFRGFVSGSNNSPWLWLDMTSLYNSKVSSCDVMILISLWMSRASS